MNPCKFKVISFQKDNEKIVDKIKEKLKNHDFIYEEYTPDLIISLGGDGTFLSSLKENEYKGYHLSINSGHLGFFSDYEINEIDKAIDDIINKYPFIEKSPLFKCNFDNKEDYFFTDLTLQSLKTISIKLYIDNTEILYTKASGIVISTALGSTGYNLSLNSPVCFYNRPILIYSLIAPVNNKMFSHTIEKGILDSKMKIRLIADGNFSLLLDGKIIPHNRILKLDVALSNKQIEMAHFKKVTSLSRIKKHI